MKKIATLLMAGALFAMVPAGASAAVRVFVGGPVVRYGFYGPGPFWANYWGPGYYGYATYPNAGEVKINTRASDAEVFIDGAYAGTVKDNKTMHLRQGTYGIELRHAGTVIFSQRVFVSAGKTIHINPVS